MKVIIRVSFTTYSVYLALKMSLAMYSSDVKTEEILIYRSNFMKILASHTSILGYLKKFSKKFIYAI